VSHLNGNFLEDRIQCSGFRYPKGRLHDLAVSSVRVTFTATCSVLRRKSEETPSYLPWSGHHRRLSRRQTLVKQTMDKRSSVTYKPTLQILGDPQAGDTCNRRCAGHGV